MGDVSIRIKNTRCGRQMISVICFAACLISCCYNRTVYTASRQNGILLINEHKSGSGIYLFCGIKPCK